MDSMFHSINCILCVCGDFNIDLIKYDRERNTIYSIDHFFMSLYLLINKPAHIKHGCHTIIENIFTNVLNNKYLSSGVIIDYTW